MKAGDLFAECSKTASEGGQYINLIKPARMPKGFPRGEFMSDTHRGKIYSFPVAKVLAWLISNNLVLPASAATEGAKP